MYFYILWSESRKTCLSQKEGIRNDKVIWINKKLKSRFPRLDLPQWINSHAVIVWVQVASSSSEANGSQQVKTLEVRTLIIEFDQTYWNDSYGNLILFLKLSLAKDLLRLHELHFCPTYSNGILEAGEFSERH